MIFFLDTTDNENITLALIKKAGVIKIDFAQKNSTSEVLTKKIKEFLKSRKVKLSDLEKVAVAAGPGHFSRLRTGVATANALAFSLNIPVISVKKSEISHLEKIFSKKGQILVLPDYGKAPNITKAKKRSLARFKKFG